MVSTRWVGLEDHAAFAQRRSSMLRILLVTCCLVTVRCLCPPDPPGYVFFVKLDTRIGDTVCIRDRNSSTWTVADQAAACNADPTCRGFNVNPLGSCLKNELGRMFEIDVKLLNVHTASPCPGLYAKSDNGCPFSDGTVFSCVEGAVFAVDHGMVRLFPNGRVYKSWGAPAPTVKGIRGGGCINPVLPVEGCRMGPFMTFRDHAIVYEPGTIGHLLGNNSMPPLFLPQAHIHYPRHTIKHSNSKTPEACERSCIDNPNCGMYEVGMSHQYRGQCWLKSTAVGDPVMFNGIISYMRNPGRTFNLTTNPNQNTGSFVRLQNVHFRGDNLEVFHTTPGACEVACLSMPGCAMFEVGTSDVFLERCWLKTNIPSEVVLYVGIDAYVPVTAQASITMPPPRNFTIRELPKEGWDTAPPTVTHTNPVIIPAPPAPPNITTTTTTSTGTKATPIQNTSTSINSDAPMARFTLNLAAVSVTAPDRKWSPQPNTHYPGKNIHLLQGVTPELCRSACLLTPGCIMYETGTADRLPNHCWLKSGVPEKSVLAQGIMSFVPA